MIGAFNRALALVLSLAVVGPVAAEAEGRPPWKVESARFPLGSDERLDLLITQFYKTPKNAALALELASNQVMKYDRTATDVDKATALKGLAQAAALAPDDAHVSAWTGVLKCLEARDVSSKAYAKEGLDLLDQAVARIPHDLGVLLIRASIAQEAPADFKRAGEAQADLESIVEQVQRTPDLATRYDLDLAEVHRKLGLAYRAAGDVRKARAQWERAVQVAPTGTEAQKARRLLKKTPAPAE